MNIGISTLMSSKEIKGVGKYIVYLINALQKVDQKNKYYIFVNNDFDDLIKINNQNFKKIKINIPHQPRWLMRPIYFIWQNTLAKRHYSKYGIDVIHLPNAIPLIRSKNYAQIVTVHDIAECVSVPRYTIMRQKFRILATKMSANNSDNIITVSNFSKSEISETFSINPENIMVAYLGVPKHYDVVNRRKHHSLNYSRPYFIHVGGGNRNKNTTRIVESYLLLASNKLTDLIFVGSPKPKIAFSRTAYEWEQMGIHFVDYIEEDKLFDLYHNAIALIYPSLYEGFGLPITEAMSCGIPVITSNITSMPEVGGDAVHYVDPYSVESIKKGMEKLLSDEPYRRSLIKKGLERYKQFTWEEAAHKTIEVYEKAALQK